ncbi:MAG: hypothetical protein VB047_09180 [Anaerotignum propionicum]|uniref:hypothetical protein n=1 Tax=Anaerotignum propionicum TaxID=28446 RepID=UPI002B2119B8|nr:hypothetical protein [Anaerotignum propionicum]MEA5057712.1 hypothetical protein [Anaerotignum propionicum]
MKDSHKQMLLDYKQMLNEVKEILRGFYKIKGAQIDLINSEATTSNKQYSSYFIEYRKLGLPLDERIKDHLTSENLICENTIARILSFDDQKESLIKLLMYYGVTDINENNLSEILSNLMIKQNDSLKCLGFDYASFQQKLKYLKRLLENQKYLNTTLNTTNKIKKYSSEKEIIEGS